MANSLIKTLDDALDSSRMLAEETELLNIMMSLVIRAYFLLSLKPRSSFIIRSIKNWFPLLAMSKNTVLGEVTLLLQYDIVKYMVPEHVDD